MADAKRGPEASRATSPATRRQLLEYRHAYAVDGVLLVDAERGRVLSIELTSSRGTPLGTSSVAAARAVLWLLIGAALGVAGYVSFAG